MSIRSRTSDFKLLGIFLSPSWVSALFALLVGALILGGTIALTHLGHTVEQSLLGLGEVYQKSSIGGSVRTVTAKFTSNTYLNNLLLFVLWGTIGLVVYSIAQSAVNELRNADELLHELDYVHTNRHRLVTSTIYRGLIRIGALVVWVILLRYFIYKILPYTVAAVHNSALKLTSFVDWRRSILATLGCMLCVHFLIVLLRLAMMHPRLLSSQEEFVD